MSHVIVVGAGFAGIATAYHLSRRGVRNIVVLEREEGPGVFASGRNAGLLRQSSDDEPTAGLLRPGARAARFLLRSIPGAIQPSGSLIMGSAIDRLRAGPRAKFLDAAELVPGLSGRALFDPEDAIIDPHALLSVYEEGARKRGVEFRYREPVTGVTSKEGRIVSVQTPKGEIEAAGLVCAAGAWAGRVASLAGSEGIEIRPLRRHLFRGSLDGADAHRWPFVWNEGNGVYFRPEGDEMLLSPCDVEPHPADDPIFDPEQSERLAEKLVATFGDLGEWRVGPGWPCLRTFTGDKRFLIGWDPVVEGLFWVAALGGHGVTSSWAVGEHAAEVYLRRRSAGPFDPARFQ